MLPDISGRVCAALLLITILGIAPRESSAQQAGPPTTESRIRLRHDSMRNTWIEGTLLRSNPDSLWIRSRGVSDTLGIERAKISKVQAYDGRTSSAGTGALIGGGFGVILFGGALIADDSGTDFQTDEAVVATVAVGGIFAVAGALVGLLVRKDKWVDVLPVGLAIEESDDSVRLSVGVGPSPVRQPSSSR